MSMKLTPSSTARRSVASAPGTSAGRPQMPLPVMRMAPKPMRFTVRSPPRPKMPLASTGRLIVPCMVMNS